jgi:hypothetical protein
MSGPRVEISGQALVAALQDVNLFITEMAQGQGRHAGPYAGLAEDNDLAILGDLVEMVRREEFMQRDAQAARQGEAKDPGLGGGANVQPRHRFPLAQPFQQGFRLDAVQGLPRLPFHGGREQTGIGLGQPIIEIPGCKHWSQT